MLGPPKPRRLDTPIAVSLEDLVPADNFYRHLETKLDLGFVREWTRELYADRGRPSIDPVVFFKLQLVLFFEGIRSERQLVATASLNLAHRWYLGYASTRRRAPRSGREPVQRVAAAIVHTNRLVSGLFHHTGPCHERVIPRHRALPEVCRGAW